MFEFLARSIRRSRAKRYVKAFPDDASAAETIFAALELRAKTAKEAAEMLAGREISAEEWRLISDRWERTWHGIA